MPPSPPLARAPAAGLGVVSDAVLRPSRRPLSNAQFTTAGPKDLAGLIEHPVIGMHTTCAANTANPIAMGAQFPAMDRLLTAVCSST
jgi:hypothetical protein